jgi:DedD protein
VNDILKQRLIGALILLALGVVFWPIIFVQPEHKDTAGQQAIPPPPAVSTEPIEPPTATGLRTSSEIAAATQAESTEDTDEVGEPAPIAIPAPQTKPVKPAPGSSTVPAQGAAPATSHSQASQPVVKDAKVVPPTTRSQAPQPLAMDAKGVPMAWTLQVATVRSAEKAEEMRKRLIAMQQKAYVTTVSSGADRLYRVCVGPKIERAELAALQARINAEFGVNTMIVRYTP